MCIFSQPVVSVSGTKIFARKTGNESQFLVYEMNFKTTNPNAMILPIPVASKESEPVRFIDLSGYEKFFEDLARGFPNTSRGLCCSSVTKASKLAVHKVGNFIASFVPSVIDFEKLDPQITIPIETWLKFPAYSDFGFVVFQLAELEGKPHPMAFEFQSNEEGIFFPTVHIHDGEVHTEEEFDHNLFLQHAGFDTVVNVYAGPHLRDPSTDFVRSQEVASECCDIEKSKGILNPNLLIHRKDLYGALENKDIICRPQGDPLIPGTNLRQFKWVWPWIVLGGIAAWFIKRRSQIKTSGRSQ